MSGIGTEYDAASSESSYGNMTPLDWLPALLTGEYCGESCEIDASGRADR